MLSTIIVLLLCSVSSQVQFRRQCNSFYEFRCDNGKCITKQQWCNGEKDCNDGSDEHYCHGTECSGETYFRCDTGRCIPLSGRCDSTKDCPDESDERNCTVAQVEYTNSTHHALSKAMGFLLKQRQQNYGWGSSISTSRANVALAFAERVYPISENEKKLMKKQLDVQLSLDLISSSDISLSHLALYINAMFATCQDPHKFQGIDLVNQLRHEANEALKSNFSLPFVLLTLCIANENMQDSGHKLEEIYHDTNKEALLSSQALTVMAMECVRQKHKNFNYSSYYAHFFNKLDNLSDWNLDVYTKALVIQASNAVGRQLKNFNLMNNQLEDGSFNDLLATYYAIPALLNSSLLDLKCVQKDEVEEMMGAVTEMNPGDNKVTYSLWIGSDDVKHSMVLSYKGNMTFYDIMKVAESKDPIYKFMCDTTDKGKQVYSLAGIPNDSEMRMSWKLYHQVIEEKVPSKPTLPPAELLDSVDSIFLHGNSSHFVFWLKRS